MTITGLDQWLGSWSGTWRTWLRPDVLHDESEIVLDVDRDDGTWVLSYRGAIGDDPVTGAIGIPEGADAYGTPELTWWDTWHTAGERHRLLSEGGGPPSYTYGPDEEPWTWSIGVEVTRDALVITHRNAPPGGPAAVAVEMTVTR